MNEGLVYVGKIIQLEPIENADFIVSVIVICGKGGKWRGIVRKNDFQLGQSCVVYLPDALIPVHDEMKFMESSNWRVKMKRFKGTPSEVVIMPLKHYFPVGCDLTKLLGVTKYEKPVPANLYGKVKAAFPSFIPKTDELNYQKYPELVEALHDKPYYITKKADGSSTTAYKYKDQFGLCSRNFELYPAENNGYWKVVKRHNLEENLPEGYALQWETCGHKIQKNRMGLKKDILGFAFSAYNIEEKRYLTFEEFIVFCQRLKFPTVPVIEVGEKFDMTRTETLGEVKYDNGGEAEGVVVRSKMNLCEGNKPISFKVINLNYEK